MRRPTSRPDSHSFALDVLQLAQEHVRAQAAASNALEAKILAVMQASIGLATAATTAGAFSIPGAKDAWMPLWAGAGFFASAVVWMGSTALCVYGLRTGQIPSSGMTTDRIRDGNLDSLPLEKARKAIAYELSVAANTYEARAKRNGKVFGWALIAMALSPAAGAVAAAAFFAWPLHPMVWVAAGGGIAALLFFRRLLATD